MLRKRRSPPRRDRTPASLNTTFWLHFFEANSLTVKLKRAAKRSFLVQILQQGLCLQHTDLQRAYTWQRHVHLCVDDEPWIEATVSIPLKTLQLSAKHLLHLKTQPIGELLFRDPGLQRGAFSLHWQLRQGVLLPERRSAIHYRHSLIQLSEIFYPAAMGYFSTVHQA